MEDFLKNKKDCMEFLETSANNYFYEGQAELVAFEEIKYEIIKNGMSVYGAFSTIYSNLNEEKQSILKTSIIKLIEKTGIKKSKWKMLQFYFALCKVLNIYVILETLPTLIKKENDYLLHEDNEAQDYIIGLIIDFLLREIPPEENEQKNSDAFHCLETLAVEKKLKPAYAGLIICTYLRFYPHEWEEQLNLFIPLFFTMLSELKASVKPEEMKEIKKRWANRFISEIDLNVLRECWKNLGINVKLLFGFTFGNKTFEELKDFFQSDIIQMQMIITSCLEKIYDEPFENESLKNEIVTDLKTHAEQIVFLLDPCFNLNEISIVSGEKSEHEIFSLLDTYNLKDDKETLNEFLQRFTISNKKEFKILLIIYLLPTSIISDCNKREISVAANNIHEFRGKVWEEIQTCIFNIFCQRSVVWCR